MATRLNKFIADQGICSRRQADRLISDGQVTINGRPAGLGDAVEPGDSVRVNGRLVKASRRRQAYVMLHKPVGFITTTDQDSPNNVMELVDLGIRLFPVGRLDVNSSGLLLLTDDGQLANRLTHPRYGHEKEYLVKLTEPINDNDLKRLTDGVHLDDGLAKAAWVRRQGRKSFRMVLRQGRNRQVRRMCEAVGHQVAALKRIRLANLTLDDLPHGRWRRLKDREIKELRELAGLD